jgi:hypothetical protein
MFRGPCSVTRIGVACPGTVEHATSGVSMAAVKVAASSASRPAVTRSTDRRLQALERQAPRHGQPSCVTSAWGSSTVMSSLSYRCPVSRSSTAGRSAYTAMKSFPSW